MIFDYISITQANLFYSDAVGSPRELDSDLAFPEMNYTSRVSAFSRCTNKKQFEQIAALALRGVARRIDLSFAADITDHDCECLSWRFSNFNWQSFSALSDARASGSFCDSVDVLDVQDDSYELDDYAAYTTCDDIDVEDAINSLR